MEFNGSSLCWNTANRACSSNVDYSSIISNLYFAYLVLVITGILPKLINFTTDGKYTDTISKYVFREIMWLHGLATFTAMKLLQPHNLRLFANCLGPVLGLGGYIGNEVGLSTLKYALQSVLVFVLWDALTVSHMDLKIQVLVNCHHLGLFIALHFGQGWKISSTDANLKSQANLDSCVYGYMWSIHSFGFILAYIFPLVGIRLREGQRSKLLDNIKYAYSLVTVYWYYTYFNADSQPGVGLNYQTLSLVTMLCGRFGMSWRNAPFIRRVEMPGMFIILADGLFFKDVYLHRSIIISLCMFVAYTYHYCYIKRHIPKPAHFFCPDKNEKLKAFLEAETSSVYDKVDDPNKRPMKKLVQTWFESNTIDPKKHKLDDKTVENCGKVHLLDPHSFALHYPLHYAVAKDDVELVEQMLQSRDVDVNEPLSEHQDTTPLQLAMWVVLMYGFETKVMLALLKNGGNPYTKAHDGKDCIEILFNTPLGGSQDFFQRYNELCVEKSPATVIFSDLSLAEKIRQVPI